MTHAKTTLKIAAILFITCLWASAGNAQDSAETTPAADSSANEADRRSPESAPEDIEARDIIVGAMMKKATETKTCSMITVVAPKATGVWQRWTSNRDLSIASVSDLGAGATISYQPIYNESGFAVGIFGKNPTIQLREHSVFGARVLYSGSKEVIKRSLEAEGYVVGFTEGVSCHFDWREATARDRYEVLLKARQSVKES